jgi:K+-sensing histidine kinase KdpD
MKMTNVPKRREGCNDLGANGWQFGSDMCRTISTTGSRPSLNILAKPGLCCVQDCHAPDNEAGLPAHKFTRANEEILNVLKIMSHDIRGPLTTLGAGLKLLKKGAYGRIDSEASYQIEQLFSVLKGLMGNVEDFLGRAFSINSGLEISSEPLHLNREVVQQVLLELSKEIQDRSISVENQLEVLPHKADFIQGDRFWLKAIFRNLIRNAIKYGGRGCRITIGFEDLKFQYRMNVHNTGKPVPKECRDRLFTKFGRISSKKNGNSESMGLGLYLVKEIVEKHGGHIWYEGAEMGSNFLFNLPKV